MNNVLCFPYIFRGALDCGATKITESMKLACVREIAALAKQDVSDEVAAAYQGKELTFGPDYLIPTPFDTRLILRIAPAVAQAAEESGVATRPIPRLRRLPRAPDALRVPNQHDHAPGVCRRQSHPPARGLRRGRRRARAAGRANRGR